MKKTYLHIAFFISLFCIAFQSNAQEPRKGLITSNKAILKKADKDFQKKSYATAIELYQQILKKEKTNNDIKLKIAESYRLLNQPEESEKWFRQIADNEVFMNSVKPIVHYNFGLVLESMGQYNYAKEWFESYQKLMPNDLKVRRKLKSIYNLEKFYADSSLYVLNRLKINTRASDISPTIYDNGIVFISDRQPESENMAVFNPDSIYFFEMYFSSMQSDGMHSSPVVFNKSFSSNHHKGSSIFYDDGRKIVFTKNSKSGIYIGKWGLYFSQKSKDSEDWIMTRPFVFNSNEYSLAHPAITSDGKTLFFSSDKIGGHGETDIWFSTLNEDGEWSEPENFSEINTSGSEIFPFVFQDSLLYFASTGHGGLGGIDIFEYNLKSDDEPRNLGYPINSEKNDFGFVLDERGYTGYFSSNRNGSAGADDIYQFKKHVFIEGIVREHDNKSPIPNVSVLLKDEKTYELKGAVTNSDGEYSIKLDIDAAYRMFAVKKGFKIGEEQLITTFGNFNPLNNVGISLRRETLLAKGIINDSNGFPLANAQVKLVDNSNNKSRMMTTGDDGLYTFSLRPESWYTITVEADGYFSKKTELDAFNKKFGVFDNPFKLKKVELEKWLVFEDIRYSSNKSDIKPVDIAELDNLAIFLNSNPFLHIKVKVHTDTRNTNKFNLDLSKTRARSILYHLAKKGIAENRIISNGFGSNDPMFRCETCTSEEDEQNRRVEIYLTKDMNTIGSGSRRKF